MKCASCDGFLTDREASRKGLFSGDYLDLCGKCISTIPDLEYVENPELSDKKVIDDEYGHAEEPGGEDEDLGTAPRGSE